MRKATMIDAFSEGRNETLKHLNINKHKQLQIIVMEKQCIHYPNTSPPIDINTTEETVGFYLLQMGSQNKFFFQTASWLP